MFSIRTLLWRLLVGPADDMQDVIEILQGRNAELIARCCALGIENEFLRDENAALKRAHAVREMDVPMVEKERN